jgi:hypothetical protein
MRRLSLFSLALSSLALGWLLHSSSCQEDRFREELPLRGFDAGTKDLSKGPPDLTPAADLATPPDLTALPDLKPPADLTM